MSKRMSASSVAGKSLAYVAGMEYDDFGEGGFSIIAVCDNMDSADEAIEKACAEFPALKENKDSLKVRILDLNHYYNIWL